MKGKKRKKTVYYSPKKLSFPGDERIYPWLSLLLNAYYIVDKGVAEAINRELKKGRKLACSKGCSNCCRTHATIPVYPLELVGISWYVTEKISGPVRETLKKQLSDYKENDPCPFLTDGICAIHHMRPISCRQFNVFSTPCEEGEDPYYTRRRDVLSPIKNYTNHAFFIMLPFYGVENESERWKLIESGAVHQVVKIIQTCNWKSMAEKMEEFDRRKG